MPVLRHLCLLLLISLLAACGQQATLPRLADGATILAFGDSITYGTGATPDESYPAQLAKLSGRVVINAGVPGNTSADGLARLADTLDEQESKPALLILGLGGNDFLRRLPEAETVANLRAMLDEAKRRQLPVLLLATPKPGLGLKVPDFYQELAKEYAIPLEDEALADILADNQSKSDLIHPNAAGYQQLAAAVAEALRDAGALK